MEIIFILIWSHVIGIIREKNSPKSYKQYLNHILFAFIANFIENIDSKNMVATSGNIKESKWETL